MVQLTTSECGVLPQDAEQIHDQLERAQIELRYAIADLSNLGARADYPEIEIAIAALDAAMAKLEQAASSRERRNNPAAN